MAGLAGWLIAGLLAVPKVDANPGVILGVFPLFPTQVSLGASGVAASINVVNGSDGLEGVGTITITDLTLVPSCGNFAANCAGGGDPGVFSLSATGTGQVGTACSLRPFNITVDDPATGRVRFTPTDGLPLLIGMPDIATDLDTCEIEFSFSVLKAPTIDTLPNDPGVSTNQIGFVSGRHLNGVVGTDQGEDVTTVLGGGPTTSSTSTTLGTTTSSSTSTSSTSSTIPVTTSSTTPTSTSSTTPTSTSSTVPTSTSSSTTPTTGPTSTTTTTSPTSTTTTTTTTTPTLPTTTATTSTTPPTTSPPVGPSLTTRASRGVPVGNQIADVATLSGLSNPTGVMFFALFGPDNATCAGDPIFTSRVLVSGNGEYISTTFVPTQPGVYRWTATYSGNANNPSLGPTPCNDPNEAVTVTGTSTPMGFSTRATKGAVGTQMADVATLAGGNNPTGQMRFRLYGPADPTCSGTPVFTSIVPVNGNGEYVSSTFVPTQPGTYRWVASYSGDANNPAQGPTACGDPNETVTVS